MASIIVIDDDHGCRSAAKRALELEGHDVRTAAEGEEGLSLCRQKPADLVVTDLFMPGKDGLETIQQLRLEFPDVPIIAVSGSTKRGPGDLLEVARHLGAKRTLAKPFDAEQFTDAVREILGDVRATIVDEANKALQLQRQKAKRAWALELLRKQAADARQRGDIEKAVEIEEDIAWIEEKRGR